MVGKLTPEALYAHVTAAREAMECAHLDAQLRQGSIQRISINESASIGTIADHAYWTVV